MLAAYIDGGLEPRERAEVEQHLAECGECYENFAETVRAQEQVSAGQPHTNTRARTLWYLSAAAAIVVISIVGWQQMQTYRAERRIDTAISALLTASASSRLADSRLIEEAPWAPRPSEMRDAAGAAPISAELRASAASLRSQGLQIPNTADGARALALDALAAGNIEIALTYARQAVERAPADARAMLVLGAIRLERFRKFGDRADAEAAVRAADRARELAPTWKSAIFNLAVALESTDRQRAVAIWNSYLKSDSNSPWATEARARIRQLESR